MLSGSLEAKENEKISLRIYNSIAAAWANCTFTQVVTPFCINCTLKAQPNHCRRHSTPPWFFLPLWPSLCVPSSVALSRSPSGVFCIPLITQSTSWMQIKDQIQSCDFLVFVHFLHVKNWTMYFTFQGKTHLFFSLQVNSEISCGF